MSKHSRWLETESERWVGEGIVSREQAARIRALYAEPAGGLSWGLIVFFGIGAIVIGCGVILLFAYNWDEIPKFGKLALIFGAMIAAHVGGLRWRAQADWKSALAEALSLLGTMGFGAGIWLVAQIYNIDEHFPNGFLIWALGALAMAWALESVGQGMLAAVLFAIWGGSEALSFHSAQDVSSLVIAGGLGPLVWRTRSPLLLATVLAALYWLLMCSSGVREGPAGVFSTVFALSVLLIAAARWVETAGFNARSRGVLNFYGWTGFLVCSFILSFAKETRSMLLWKPEAHGVMLALAYRWLLFALALAAWGYLAIRWRRGQRELIALEDWLCPIALIYAQALLFMERGDEAFVATVFNLVCLGTAAAWMVRGCREGLLRKTVLGSLVLAAVLFARYFDLFDSLALRGLAFVVLGGVLFAEGFYYRKLRREETEARA